MPFLTQYCGCQPFPSQPIKCFAMMQLQWKSCGWQINILSSFICALNKAIIHTCMVIIAMLMFIDEICFVLLSAKSFSLHKKPQCHIGIRHRQAPLSKQPQLKGLTACVKFIWAFHRHWLGLNKPATKHYLNKCTSWSVALSKMSKTNVTKATFNNCQQLPCKTGSISKYKIFQSTVGACIFSVGNHYRCREKNHTWRRGSTLVNINTGYPFFNSITEHIPACRYNEETQLVDQETLMLIISKWMNK